MSIGDTAFGLEISKGVVAKFSMAALGFVGSIIFARELGPAGYGAFYLILTLVNILDNPVTGWGNACKKRLTETDFPTDEALGSGIIGAVASAFIVLPGMYLFIEFVDIFEIGGLFIPFCALYVSVSLFAVSYRILSGRANFSRAEWADTLRSVFTLPLQLLLVVVLGIGVAGMVYGLAAATLLTVPYVLYGLGVRPALPTKDTISSIRAYAKFSIPSAFVGTAQSRVDVLLLGALIATTDAVGYYEVALKLTMPAIFIAGVMSSGLLGRVSNLLSRGKPVEEDVTNSLAYAGLLATPIFFGALAIPEPLLVTIYGGDFRPAVTFLAGLALYRLLSTQTTQLTSVVAGLDRPDVNMWLSAGVLVLNVILGYALLRAIGPVGVVIATIASECIMYLGSAYIVKRNLPGVQLAPRPLLEQLGAGVVMYVVVEQSYHITGVRSWIDLGLLLAIGGVTYFAILVAVSKELRFTVRGILSDALAD